MNKILIIEDDLEINALLADFLKEKGYAVHCQYDGLHVLDFLNKEKIDLIILDIMLPYRSGDIILSDVRKKFTIPVIIISAKETTQNKIDLLRLGADDYITKPFDMEEVLARIESNLRRVQFQNSQTECLQYNNLTLDLEKNTAFLNGIELSLTAKEFGILELLMKYPDKVFSKSNLFQSVWDTEYIAEDNTLNVHISNLRNKLKAICSDTEFIDTVLHISITSFQDIHLETIGEVAPYLFAISKVGKVQFHGNKDADGKFDLNTLTISFDSPVLKHFLKEWADSKVIIDHLRDEAQFSPDETTKAFLLNRADEIEQELELRMVDSQMLIQSAKK